MNKFVRALAAVVVAGSTVSSAAAAAKEACVSGAAEQALQLRTVQTELMVGALSCSASARYNEFVKANQPALMAGHTELTRFFTKARGGQGAMNAFITKLANDASIRSVKNIALFCQETGWLYDAMLSPQRGDLAAFTARLLVAQRHGYAPCSPPATYVVLGPNGPQEAKAAAAAPAAPAAPAGAAVPPSVAADGKGAIPTPRPKPPNAALR
jgi:hypothetical protein